MTVRLVMFWASAATGFLCAALVFLATHRTPVHDAPPLLVANCTNEFTAARQDLDRAVEDLRQGRDEEVDFEAFRARMEATLVFCFPRDDDHPDDVPQDLLYRRHGYPSVDELQHLADALDAGWRTSHVGTPWRRPVR